MVAKDESELQALYDSFDDPDDTGRNNAMTDQLRVRIHNHGMKAQTLPKMHGGDGKKRNAERLLGEFKSSPIFFKVPGKLNEPAPYPERAAHPAPSSEAEGIERAHAAKFQSAWKEMMELTKEGIFTAPKRKGGNGGVGGSRKRKPRKAAQKQERSLKEDEIALVRTEFVEDGTKWKVLAVDWSDDDHDMVVWYYDIEAANMEEEEMEEMRITDRAGEVDALEFSSVPEVKKWIKMSE